MSDRNINFEELIFFLLEYKENPTYIRKHCEVAEDLLLHYTPPTDLIDRVIERYLSSISNHSLVAPTTDLILCFNLCKRASSEIVEKVLSELIRFRMYNHAQYTAVILKRSLTKSEVLDLINRYTRGGVSSDSTENLLREIAEESGGKKLLKKANKTLSYQRKRDALDVL